MAGNRNTFYVGSYDGFLREKYRREMLVLSQENAKETNLSDSEQGNEREMTTPKAKRQSAMPPTSPPITIQRAYKK